MTDTTNVDDATLMAAVLAMDAYNHKPASGSWSVDLTRYFPGLVDGKLGTGNVIAVSTSFEQIYGNFYAIAYQFPTGPVIAYRGTSSIPFDLVNGYEIGAGSSFAPDAYYALSFYKSVAAQQSTDLQSSGIVVTGHSLGGGLAGFVGAIYGLSGFLFDNMTFNNAAEDAYETGLALYAVGSSSVTYGLQKPYPNVLTKLNAYATTGELLSVLLPGRYLQTPQVQYLNSYGGARSILTLHSMALLTTLIYAKVNDDADWHSVGVSLANTLFDSRVPKALGLGGNSDILQEIIAYSAITSGYQPFGRAALKSLFSDADKLGEMQSNNEFVGSLQDTSSFLDASESGYFGNGNVPSPADALMEIAVQFAGDQAASAGAEDMSNASMTGVLSDVSGGALTVNLDPTKWTATFGDKGQDQVVGVSDLIQGVIYNVLNVDSSTTVGGEKADNVINKFVTQTPPSEIDVALTSNASIDSTDAKNAYQSNKPETIAVGQKDSGTITAGDGDNLIFGGQTVKVGNGNNIIVGEAGGETITIGGGSNAVMATGAGNTINIEAKDSSSEHPGINFIYAGEGAETFNFDSGQGDAGIILQSVSNFSKNALLDLDQASLTNYLNSEFAGTTGWQDFENHYSNGLGGFDWTVILVKKGQPINDTFEINGGAITSSTFMNSTPVPDRGYTGSDDINGFWSHQYYESSMIFSIDYGALNLNVHFPSGGNSIDLNQYLQKPTAPAMPASPHANFLHADAANSFVSPRATDAAQTGDTVNVAQFESGSSALDDRFGGFGIADTAANIGASFDDIANDGNINSITLTDAGTPVLQLDAAQSVDDTSALGEITNSAFNVAVSDSAANVSANFDSLAADTRVSTITLTDDGTPSLDLSAAQIVYDSAALADITNTSYTIVVTDTAADVSQLLDQLQANPHVGSITLTDSGDPTLDLSVAQLSSDAGVLGTITNGEYAIAVGDTAANVVANAQLLQGNSHVSGVTVTDTAANVLLDQGALQGDSQVTAIQIIDTAQNVLNNESALGQISQISAVVVEDSAAHVVANAQALSSDSQVTGVWVVDSAANIVADATILSADSQVQAQIVEDTAAAVSASFDALNADSGVSGIVLTDGGTPTLRLTAAQALNDTSALGRLETTNVVLDVVDSAANVAANLDALGQDQQIAGITLDDPTPQPLQVTASQVTDDFGILQTITNPGYTIAVTDTSAEVAANLDALTANGHVASITLTDPSPAILDLTATQAADDGAALAAIQNPYAVAISDRALNVAANLNALNTNPDLISITLSDVMSPTLDVNATQALGDRTVIGDITNDDWTLTVTDTAANIIADTTALNSLPQRASINVADTVANVLADGAALSAAVALSSVDVVDTAADVSANIDALNAAASPQVDGMNNGRLTTITLTDAGTPTLVLTASQAVDDTDALLDISNAGYAVSVVDSAANVASNFDALAADRQLSSITLTDADPVLSLSASQVANDANALGVISNSSYAISVTDSAANVAANIDALNNNPNVTQISLTDPGTPILAVSADQAVFDMNAFASIVGPYTVAVSDTVGDVLADIGALSLDPSISTLDVVDTAAAILANSAALQADQQITSVSVLDDAENIAGDAQSLAADRQVISIVATATASEALSSESGLGALTAPLKVQVRDTAANVTAKLDALNVDAQVSSITLTDSGTPTLILNASQVVNDAATLDKIYDPLFYAPSYRIAVEDTAANVSAYFKEIQSDLYAETLPIESITLTDVGVPTLTLTMQEVSGTESSYITNVNYQIAIVDTASDISAYSYEFSYASNITSVNVVDTAADVSSFGPELNGIPNLTSISIVDTAADVSVALDELNAYVGITSITLTDGGSPTLALSVAQALDDTTALSKITNGHYRITIDDTAADVLANLSALTADSSVVSIKVRDTADNILADASALAQNTAISVIDVVDTAANVLSDGGALGSDTFISAINVLDTSADVADEFDALNDDPQISSIAISDGTPVLTLLAEQALSDTTALSKLKGALVVVSDTVGDVLADETQLDGDASVSAIAIQDTAANVLANASTLTADPKIGSINVYDTAANILSYAGALNAIPAIASVSVADTAAAVSTDLDLLDTDTQIATIALSGGAGITLTLTAAQATDDQSALDKIVGPYGIAVSDSATDITADYDALNADALFDGAPITSITFTDSDPVLTLTILQARFETDILSLVSNPGFSVTVRDTAGNFSTYGSGITTVDPFVSAVDIVDTAADVAASLDALDSGLVTSISLTDSGTPTLSLSAAQVIGDTSALGKITNAAYTIAVSDSAANIVGDASALSTIPAITSINVSDNVANILADEAPISADNSITSVFVQDYSSAIASNFDALNSDDQITSIALTDGPNRFGGFFSLANLMLNASQLQSDALALSKIVDSNYVVTGSNDTFVLGKNDTVSATGTNNTYVYVNGDGKDAIAGGASSNTATVEFGGTTPENLWFQQVGENLEVDLMGSRDSLTVDDWFGPSYSFFGGGTAAAVQSFIASDGSTIEAQVGQLVSAMATYSADNPGFNPTLTSQIPANADLQAAVTASWHKPPSVVAETASAVAGQTDSADNTAGALVGDNDPSGGTLTVTAVSFGGMINTIATSGSATIEGTYGSLTLASDGSYSYAATNGLAIVTAADGLPITDIFGDTVTTSEGTSAPSSLAITVSLAASGAETVMNPTGYATYKIGATTLTLNETATSTYGGVIQDGSSGNVGGSLAISGLAPLTLTGVNTYTGNTSVSGILDVVGSGSIAQASKVSLTAAGATFDISGASSTVSINKLGGVAGSFIDLGAGTLNVNEGIAGTFAGIIQDGGSAGGTGGSLTVAGTKALTLTSVETYTGKTSVSGILDLTGTGSIHSSSKVSLTTAGATLDISGATAGEVINKLGGIAGTVADLGGQNLKIKVQGGTVDTFSGTIKDGGSAGGSGGSLTLGGLGELSLTAADSYTSGTTIAAGTLDIAALGAAGSGTITFANPASNGVATLEIDAAALSGGSGTYSFANAIAGATSTNQVIDLSSLAYVQGSTTATLNGTTLSVTDGSSNVTLHLAAAQAKSSFMTASDGHGGTLVYDPPATTKHAPATAKIDTSWIEMAMADFGGVTGDGHANATMHAPYDLSADTAFEHPHRLSGNATRVA